MGKISIEELERELNATDEAYVRRKLLNNRFDEKQACHVAAWLALRDREREELRVQQGLALSRSTVLWAKLAALGTVFAGIVAFLTLLK